MKKNPEAYLKHILECINYINVFTNQTKASFFKSVRDQDATIRRIEIIGEAAKQLPADFKKKHSKIPWRDISDMRNVLIHEYFGVDLEQVWKVSKEDLHVIEKQINEIMGY